MTYASLMVHLEPGRSNAGLLNVTADIAQQFHARVVGIAACQPMQLTLSDGYIPPEIIEADREQIESEITKVETEFRGALKKRGVELEWRSKITYRSACRLYHARSTQRRPHHHGRGQDELARRVEVT